MQTLTRRILLSLAAGSLGLFVASVSFAADHPRGEADETPATIDEADVEYVRPMFVQSTATRDLEILVGLSRAAPSTDSMVEAYFNAAFGPDALTANHADSVGRILEAGLAVGILPCAAEGSPIRYRRALKWLEQNATSAHALSDDVRSALETYLDHSKESDGDAARRQLVDVFEAVVEELERPRAHRRAHGYFLTGLWTGFAAMDVTAGVGSRSLRTTGSVILRLLRRDAAFGPRDQKLASHLASIARELRSETPSRSDVLDSVRAMRTVPAGKSDSTGTDKTSRPRRTDLPDPPENYTLPGSTRTDEEPIPTPAGYRLSLADRGVIAPAEDQTKTRWIFE